MLTAPKLLKSMLLKLQKHNLQMQYKRGVEIHTADFFQENLQTVRVKKKNNSRIHQQMKQIIWTS